MYVPHHGDMHFEHGMIYEACLVATRPMHNQSVKRILAYETPSETEWAPPLAEPRFCADGFHRYRSVFETETGRDGLLQEPTAIAAASTFVEAT